MQTSSSGRGSALRRLLVGACIALAVTAAPAQQFPPNKPVTMLVGFAPGGAADTAARAIARRLAENIGQQVVIENKAGAGGNIAHADTARGPVDGSLILFGSVGPLSIAQHLMKLPYDPVRDLAPLTMGVNFPNLLVVNAELKIRTLAEFVAYAKRNPGKLECASTGSGSASHLACELFNDMAKIEVVHVPYKGGSQIMPDLLSGRVASYYSTPSTAGPHLQAGKIVAIASTGLARSPAMPNLPTVAESGYAGFEALNWYAFVGSAKMPVALLDRWNAELVKALNAPDVREALNAHGLTPAPGTREELGRYIAAEAVKWGRVIRERKITGE